MAKANPIYILSLLVISIYGCKKKDVTPQSTVLNVSKLEGKWLLHGTMLERKWNGAFYDDTTYTINSREITIHRLSDSAILAGFGDNPASHRVFVYESDNLQSLMFLEQYSRITPHDTLYTRITYKYFDSSLLYEDYRRSGGVYHEKLTGHR
ncbi:MAG: hypothetical protein V4649_13540 [Bacteroidota bacterium]